MNLLKKTPLWMICGFLAASGFAAQQKPNIVLLYIDDWAWNGSPVPMDDSMKNSKMPILQMPNIERLAKGGMKFSNAYGTQQCAPARVCIQTGQCSPHNGYTVVLGKLKNGDDYYDTRGQYSYMPMVPAISDTSLDANAVTIADILNRLGYVSAHFGKWHMYCKPEDHGYAQSDGETTNSEGNTLGKWAKAGGRPPKRIPDDMTDPKRMFSLTDRAIGFMEEQVKEKKPFYLQVSFWAMHAGRECLPATREKYVKNPLIQAWYKENGESPDTINRKSDPAVWFGMGEDLDGRIGAILDKIKALGIEDNTYVVMSGDNGYRHHELEVTPGMTQPLHGAKWWTWQGGLRVPMIAKGPGIKPGSVFTGNVINYDFKPTFFDWAGGDPATLKDIDGVSLAGYMAGQKPAQTFLNRNLYFHYPHYRESVPDSAIISGNYKVIYFYERPDIPMLFDLSKDPGEVSNIAKQNPETYKRLFGEMMGYLKQVGARFPKPNPNYDPEAYIKDKKTATRIKWGPFEGQRPLEDDE